jgi:tetratricopeptide (TPR) repeat protein
MARELAALIPGLKREKKEAEAKALGDGVTLLLKELAAIPNLSPSSTLFIGQTLYTVERHDAALKEFEKIKPPARADWAKVELDKIADGQERNKLRNEIRDYRFAQLYTAKAYRGANKIDEAEKLLTGIVGTPEARGWGYASYDFRRELALTHEAKAAAIPDKKAANAEWVKALKEWTTLFQFAQSRIKNLPPNATPAQVREAKSAFFEGYYEIQRVMVAANTQLQAPAALAKSLETAGKRIADMENTNKIAEQEKAGPSIITPDVWNHFCDLLDQNPMVKNAYKANGGKLFLERPAEQ